MKHKKKLQSWMGVSVAVETPGQNVVTGTVVSQLTVLTIQVDNPAPGQSAFMQSIPSQLAKVINNTGGQQ